MHLFRWACGWIARLFITMAIGSGSVSRYMYPLAERLPLDGIGYILGREREGRGRVYSTWHIAQSPRDKSYCPGLEMFPAVFGQGGCPSHLGWYFQSAICRKKKRKLKLFKGQMFFFFSFFFFFFPSFFFGGGQYCCENIITYLQFILPWWTSCKFVQFYNLDQTSNFNFKLYIYCCCHIYFLLNLW